MRAWLIWPTASWSPFRAWPIRKPMPASRLQTASWSRQPGRRNCRTATSAPEYQMTGQKLERPRGPTEGDPRLHDCRAGHKGVVGSNEVVELEQLVAALKKAAAALRDAEVPFALGGGFAA